MNQISVTFNFNSPHQALDLMAAYSTLIERNPYAQAKAIHSEPKPTLLQGDIQVVTANPVAVRPAPAPAPATKSPAEQPVVDFQAVKATVIALSKKRGTPAAVQLLERFKAKRVSDLREDQYRDVLAAAAEALADKEAA